MPYSKNIIGALLNDPRNLDACIDACPVHELTGPAAIVYRAMAQMAAADQVIDLVTVAGRTRELGVSPIWLTEAMENVIGSKASQYAKLQHDEFVKGQVKQYVAFATGISQDTEKTSIEMLNELSRGLEDFEGELKQPKDTRVSALAERYLRWFDDVKNNKIRMLSCNTVGLVNNDDSKKSFIPFWCGGLTVLIAAYSTVGKSAFACNMAIREAEAGNKVLIFSNEMGEFGYCDRGIGYYSDIPYGQIKHNKLNGKDLGRIDQALLQFSVLPLHIDIDHARSSNEIIRRIKRTRYQFKPDIVILDYLQNLVPAKGESRYDSISRQHKELVAAAAKYEFSLVCLSQVSNQSGKGEIEDDAFMDVKGSGDVAADASVFIGLKRKTMDADHDQELTMIVKKNRDYGYVAAKDLFFNKSFTKIQEYKDNV